MAGEKVSTTPDTVIRATSPTSSGGNDAGVLGAVVALGAAALNTKNQSKDVTQAKATDFGVDKIAGGMFGASEKTQRFIKDAIVSDGKSKSAQIGLGFAALDKLTGKNLSGIYEAVAGQDLFDLFDKKKEPKSIPNPLNPNGVLAKMRQRGDPLLSFDWRVDLPVDLTQAVAKLYGLQDPDLLNYYVEDVNVTPRSLNSEAVFRRGSQVHYPGWMETGSISITFYEDQRMLATKFVDYWQGLVRNEDGTYNLPSKYKKPILIYCLDVQSRVASGFLALNCWPTNIQGYTLQSSSSDIVKVTVDFATDCVCFVPYDSVSTDTAAPVKQENEGGGYFNIETNNPILNSMIEKAGINKKLNTAAQNVIDKVASSSKIGAKLVSKL